MVNPIKIILPRPTGTEARKAWCNQQKQCYSSKLSILSKQIWTDWREWNFNEGWSCWDETKMRVVTVGRISTEPSSAPSSVRPLCGSKSSFVVALNDFHWCCWSFYDVLLSSVREKIYPGRTSSSHPIFSSIFLIDVAYRDDVSTISSEECGGMAPGRSLWF